MLPFSLSLSRIVPHTASSFSVSGFCLRSHLFRILGSALECDVACFYSNDHRALWQATTTQRTPKLAVDTFHCPIARKQGPALGVGRAVRHQSETLSFFCHDDDRALCQAATTQCTPRLAVCMYHCRITKEAKCEEKV